MAYPRHQLVTFGGYLSEDTTFAPNETWSCNIRIVPGIYGHEADYLNEIQSTLKAWYVLAGNKMTSDASLNWIKCNEIAPDGKYANPTTPHTYSYAAGWFGPQTPEYPNIMSACFSWTTALSRGPGHTGRIYPPVNTPPFAAGSMKLSVASQTAMVTTAKALLTVIANASGTYVCTPKVVSTVSSSANTITGVRVGNIIDVQRRRKRQLAESYLSATFP